MTHRIVRGAGVAALLASALALTACAGGSATDTSTASGSAPAAFTFPDARKGVGQLRLGAVPKVVVAQSSVAAALRDAGYKVAGAYGELTPDRDGKLNYQAGSLDLHQLKVIGSTYGEFDLDRYALTKPDLLIDYSFSGAPLWYVPTKQSTQILGLAPSLGVPGEYPSTDAAIAEFVDLAGKLGADVDSPALAAEKTAYRAAEAAAERAAAGSKLKVLVVSPTKDTVYVADPAQVPELKTLTGAGLDILTPKKIDDLFTQVSWEQMSDFADADVILVDARSYDTTLAAIKNISAWKNLPAVKAGQVYPWFTATPYSYKAYAKVYDGYAEDLEKAEPVG